jgi:hypothetical protein
VWTNETREEQEIKQARIRMEARRKPSRRRGKPFVESTVGKLILN